MTFETDSQSFVINSRRRASRSGLLQARTTCSDLTEADNLAPEVWKVAKTGRIQKRKVWAQKIKTQKDQLPIAGSADESVLS